LFGLEIIVIFVIIWWLVLFVVLPFGIQRDENSIKGNDPGAPKNPMLKKKIYFTTIISIFLSILVSWIKNEIF
jgi:predicted secreted protein